VIEVFLGYIVYAWVLEYWQYSLCVQLMKGIVIDIKEVNEQRVSEGYEYFLKTKPYLIKIIS